VTIADV